MCVSRQERRKGGREVGKEEGREKEEKSASEWEA